MSGTPRPPSQEKRPTLRTIAAEADLTHATVSMALRNHPSIPTKTRRRIQRIAEKVGYRPDPEVAKLMHHLRQKHKPRFKSIIAALTNIPKGADFPYLSLIEKGARDAAAALGYGFEIQRVDAIETRNVSLQRILRSRGIEGVVLLPMKHAMPLNDLLDWSFFTVIAATWGVLSPDFHRVLPDQFGNNLLICEELVRLGHRRIGLVLDARTDMVVGHRFTAPIAWQNTLGGTEDVRPFIHPPGDLSGLQAWFARERPDAIIAGEESVARMIARELRLKIPGPVGFALIERQSDDLISGIDQRAEDIGRAAITQAHERMKSGEKGIPAVPSITMIKGRWIASRRRSR
jgi:DNA-binding LacI/PurR family transcriptional regulator